MLSPRPHSTGSSSGRGQTPLETEVSIFPGETEEDGLLRREYVLVGNTRAVEFDRAVDGKSHPLTDASITLKSLRIEIHAHRRRPLRDRRVPPPVLADEVLPIIDLTNSPRPSSSPTTFPPRSLAQGPSHVPTSYSPPLTSALARALNLASKTLFGRRPGGAGYSPPAKKGIIRDRGRTTDEAGVEDPAEEELLARLEDLAQKTQVLTNWADEMYEYVKAIPQSVFMCCN